MEKQLAEYLAAIRAGTSGSPVNIEDMVAATGASRALVLARLRTLQEQGEGYLKLGRHGHPTRFYLRSKSLPQAAPDGALRAMRSFSAAPSRAAADVAPPSSADAQAPVAPPSSADAGEMVTHVYQLRRGLTVSIVLPADLNEREAGRLARFIETLAL